MDIIFECTLIELVQIFSILILGSLLTLEVNISILKIGQMNRSNIHKPPRESRVSHYSIKLLIYFHNNCPHPITIYSMIGE